MKNLLPSKELKTFPIIGMGGSAGSFSAFEKFFSSVNKEPGFAFVIIMHLDPNGNLFVKELLQKFTSMPVSEAQDGVIIKVNHVYVIPRNNYMEFSKGKLLLIPALHPHGHRLPIDHFFISLAENLQDHAIGIIFSGMGSDGKEGIISIKKNKGLVLVQDPESAEFDSMPQAAIETSKVDYVLFPAEMPAQLMQCLQPLPQSNEEEEIILTGQHLNSLQKILNDLRTYTTHDFSQYKKSTIIRRIDRRVSSHKLENYKAYVSYLKENPAEYHILFKELLIGFTKFFRDRAAFEVLKENLLCILKSKDDDGSIRVWVSGTSSGEEAYSIAIILLECLDEFNFSKNFNIQIFATDLDEIAITKARAGIYTHSSISEVSTVRLQRFFIKKDDKYQVKKELRDMIIFASHNVIKDAPFIKLDLLCCRNLMIYFNVELQKKLLLIFRYSLNDKGLLFLGPSETLGAFSNLFDVVDSKWKIFENKKTTQINPSLIDFTFNVSKINYQPPKWDTEKMLQKSSIASSFKSLILEKYAPASVIINTKGDILYMTGKIRPFIELSAGEGVLNINIMANEDIKYALSNAIFECQKQKGSITLTDLNLNQPGDIIINLEVHLEYISEGILQGLIAIVFEKKMLEKKSLKKSRTKVSEKDEKVEELERKLVYSQQQLYSTIEEMEISIEELKSTNEELQSTNEELQSTNEESITTKEEMQSLNEELITINHQHQSQAEELAKMNNDMKNFLDSTEIGILFLDNQLNIVRFTPQIKTVLKLTASDVGKPFNHIVSNFDYPKMEEQIEEVIKNLLIKELQVKTSEDWYNVRILPYRTISNHISGAVLTFNNITKLKKLEFELNKTLKSTQNILANVRDGLAVLDENLRIIYISKAFAQLFGVNETEVIGIFIYELDKGFFVKNNLKKLLEETTINRASLSNLILDHVFPESGKKKISFNAKPILNEVDSNNTLLLLMVEDLSRETL